LPSRRRHTRSKRDWSSDVCSSDLKTPAAEQPVEEKEPVQQDTRDGEAKFISAPRQRSVGESILAQEMLYRNQGYEPTHQVCSVEVGRATWRDSVQSAVRWRTQ